MSRTSARKIALPTLQAVDGALDHAGRLMAYKLLDMAENRWRKLNGPELLPLVRAGVRFVDGVRQERPNETEGKGVAA